VTSLRPLAEMVALLDSADIPHMLVGSFASTYHSWPRSTQDIDLVIDPPHGAIETFIASVPVDDWYLPYDIARVAVRERSQFNVIDHRTAWKVDLIVRKDRPFSRSEFDRRTDAIVSGVRVSVASREDTILAKLEWARLGASDRHVEDARAVLHAGSAVDDAYLDLWAPELGVEDLLERARQDR
jgi:hypothetical protein